jgi:hypothetical protein
VRRQEPSGVASGSEVVTMETGQSTHDPLDESSLVRVKHEELRALSNEMSRISMALSLSSQTMRGTCSLC